MSKPMRIAIFTGRGPSILSGPTKTEYYWKLLSGANSVLLTSEGYKTVTSRDNIVTKAADELGLSVVIENPTWAIDSSRVKYAPAVLVGKKWKKVQS